MGPLAPVRLYFFLRFEVNVSQGLSATACLGDHAFRAWISAQMFRICGNDAMKPDGTSAWKIEPPKLNDVTGHLSYKVILDDDMLKPVKFTELFDGQTPERLKKPRNPKTHKPGEPYEFRISNDGHTGAMYSCIVDISPNMLGPAAPVRVAMRACTTPPATSVQARTLREQQTQRNTAGNHVYDSTAEFDYSLDQIKELLRATEKHWVLQVQLAVGRAKEAKANPEHLENLTRALIRDFGLQAPSDLRVTEAFNCIAMQVESDDTTNLLKSKDKSTAAAAAELITGREIPQRSEVAQQHGPTWPL